MAFDIPSPARQIAFHELLVAARKQWLKDALGEALGNVEPKAVKEQITALVPADAQKILAASGIRDEHVFPAPVLLEAQPTLIGYYRLLLGVSQKAFYGSGTGLAPFRSMETRGTITARQREALPDFCAAMSVSLAELVRQISPPITNRDVDELPLLTLGSQFQGANNNVIGKQAIVNVFLAVSEIVAGHVTGRTDQRLTVTNASGRIVHITLASDPDIRIEEDVGGALHHKLAIEVKGGTDSSNVHNRAGEAEKSHQKARGDGFREFWTIISLASIDPAKLKTESPTTNSWFDVAHILARSGKDWDEFRQRLAGVVGIPLGK